MQATKTRRAHWLAGALTAAVLACCHSSFAQATCTSSGYRVLARRWDVILQTGWELRQNCAHPEWPARSFAVSSKHPSLPTGASTQSISLTPPVQLVHAGEPVRLWLQDVNVRIEMSGVAEQSGSKGDRVTVRITRQTEADGFTVDRISGTVRAAGDVEMER